jgi:hypothetical protein
VIPLKLSSRWNSKVYQQQQHLNQYQYLFEQKTAYQSSPVDGISLLTDHQLRPEAINLLKSLGSYLKLDDGSPYQTCLSLGVVTLMCNPKPFTSAPLYKVKINPSEGGLTLNQGADWARYLVGDEKLFRVNRCDYKVDIKGKPSARMQKEYGLSESVSLITKNM